ncbi:winged helix-turn-helix domain-containing protein [Streptomyces sp. NPDC005962]|uniref:winged helix-turn-helix domain-containing protein n=1 Tax=Streptomyces sp. NPDC005962 TaxID=3154466 RepID=UPI0033CA3CF0
MSNSAAAPGRPRAGARRAAAERLPRSSGRPPYRLVADDLRRQILVGRLAPGDQVPPSRILQEDYGIADMTARSAVRVLRDEGLVRTEHGRGTFVAHPLLAGSLSATADRPHMPTDEYTELSRRIDELDDVLDTLLRLFGQAGSLRRRSAAPVT